MARHRVICIQRRDRSEDPHRHISHLGLGDEGGWSRVLMVEEISCQLQSDSGDRYYVRGRDGWEAEIPLDRCPFCPKGHTFIRSAPDLNAPDKLLTLPACGE